MIVKHLVAAAVLLLCACVSSPPSEPSSEAAALRAELKRLQDENALLNLKLQDEIERGTIQVFLMRQEIVAAKRETAAVQTRCGSACAATPARQ